MGKSYLIRIVFCHQNDKKESVQKASRLSSLKTVGKIISIMIFVFSTMSDRYIKIYSEIMSAVISMTSMKVFLLYVLIIEMMRMYFRYPSIPFKTYDMI